MCITRVARCCSGTSASPICSCFPLMPKVRVRLLFFLLTNNSSLALQPLCSISCLQLVPLSAPIPPQARLLLHAHRSMLPKGLCVQKASRLQLPTPTLRQSRSQPRGFPERFSAMRTNQINLALGNRAFRSGITLKLRSSRG